MKKFTFSFLVLILLSVTLTHSYGHAQENSISDNGEKSFNELKKA